VNKKLCVTALLPFALAGCAINQTVKPVDHFEGKEVCIILNLAVQQAGFLEAFKSELMDKGYTVKTLPPDTSITECPVTSTYTANWRWDLALYLAYVDIRVFKNGVQSGEAIYDSLRGGANMNKFIRGEAKVRELVDQLFPGGAKPAPK
jgi:hypothetical protein